MTQLHFTTWPDHGVPDKDQMDQFDTMIGETLKVLRNQSEQGVLVHCSAGVGRTGTFLALVHLIATFEEQKLQGNASEITLSPFSTVRRLREQRLYQVQTEAQYRFIYRYLTSYLRKQSK